MNNNIVLPKVGEIVYCYATNALHITSRTALIALNINDSDSFITPMFDSLVQMNSSALLESVRAIPQNYMWFYTAARATLHVNVARGDVEANVEFEYNKPDTVNVSVVWMREEFYLPSVSPERAVDFVEVVLSILDAINANDNKNVEYVVGTYKISRKYPLLVIERHDAARPIIFYFTLPTANAREVLHVIGYYHYTKEV